MPAEGLTHLNLPCISKSVCGLCSVFPWITCELEIFYTTSHGQPKCHFPSEGFLSLPQYTGVSLRLGLTLFYNSAFRSVVLRPAASVSAGNLLEMQIPRPHAGSTESDTLGGGAQQLVF